MAPVIMQKKKTSALGKLGLWWLKNFADGYCGDLSVLALCLVDNGGFHPLQAQQVLYPAENRGRVMDLLGRGRKRFAEVMCSGPRDEFYVDGPVKGEEENLPDREAWTREVICGGPLDVRGTHLVAKQFLVPVQILQQMVESDAYMLRDADGLTTPLRNSGRILWTSKCHFEAVVLKVRRGVFNQSRNRSKKGNSKKKHRWTPSTPRRVGGSVLRTTPMSHVRQRKQRVVVPMVGKSC